MRQMMTDVHRPYADFLLSSVSDVEFLLCVLHLRLKLMTPCHTENRDVVKGSGL